MPTPGYPIPQSPPGTVDLYAANHYRHLNRTVDLRGHYDAQGDGATDDFAALQDAIDGTPDGGALFIPPTAAGYKLSDTPTIDHPMTVFGYRSLITQTGTDKNGFNIASSGVHLEGLYLYGRQHAVFANEDAIHIVAPSWASRYTDVTVKNCRWENWGQYGIRATYVEDFEFSGNRSIDVCYSHIQCLSAYDGTISNNRIKGVGAGTSGNWYGVALARIKGGDHTSDPECESILVEGNRIWDIPWEGIDTHGGVDITISNNITRNCLTGIAVNEGNNASGGPAVWGPKNISVLGNTLISDVTDGSYRNGITFEGAGTGVGAVVDPGTGSIIGNTIQGYGAAAGTGARGGIVLLYTDGMQVSDNTLIRCAGHAIEVYHDNSGFSITANTMVDTWATSPTDARIIHLNDDYNDGFIGGNTATRSDLDGTGKTVNSHFLYMNTDTANGVHSSVRLGVNRSEATTYVRDTLGTVTTGNTVMDTVTAANTLGPLSEKREVQTTDGTSLGWLPIYSYITYVPYAGVSGLEAWYDARAINGTDGVGVSVWNDLTANHYHLTQSSGSLQPLYKATGLNSKPTVRFDGTNDILRSTAAGLLALFAGNDASTTLFFVCQFNGETGNDTFFFAGNDAHHQLYRVASTDRVTVDRKDDALASATGVNTTALAVSTPTLIIVRGNATSYDITVAGVTQNATVNVGTMTPTLVDIGGHGSQFASIDISHMVFYGSSLSDGNRTTVTDALVSDWGL